MSTSYENIGQLHGFCESSYPIKAIRVVARRSQAVIAVATVQLATTSDAWTAEVPVVIYDDGTIIAYHDWQAPRIDDEEIIAEADDPKWGRHWFEARTGAPVVIIDGLPRLF